MALTVEDGTGKVDADSYLSEADADTYWAAHGNPSTWSGITSAQKEEALRLGTQYLDLQYGQRWRGWRTNETQSLAWPRSGVRDDDGFAIDSDAIPTRLEDATAEAAIRHLTETDGLMPDIDDPGIKKLLVKVGPITESTEYIGAADESAIFSTIEALLAPIIMAGTAVYRG